jgi:cysteinyl-tRNA synthetase
MSMKYLGESFDIHAGGIDLIFPHHENEIAQSEGATGVKPFAQYWIHFEHLKVDGESMSKTKGNYYTFRDLLEKGYAAVAVRYYLMSVPYNKQLNFTFDALRGAEKSVMGLRDFHARLVEARVEPGMNPQLHEAAERALKDFEAGLDDDLNTSVAFAAIHNLSREVNTAIACQALQEDNKRELLDLLGRFDSVFNIFGKAQETEMLDVEIQSLIDERQEARRRRDFARADEIRQQLAARGITLEDTKDGVRWKNR